MGAAVAGAGAALLGLVSSTAESRAATAKLNTAFETAGSTAEQAAETYNGLYRVLGDGDVAVEAANHLAKLTTDQQSLSEWTNICQGIYATFGDSLPIEGLTEAANETAKVGALTGGLADALNWAGVNEDEFQAKLDACNTEAEREALIRETLTGLYSDAAAGYEENAAAILAQNEAQAKLDSAMDSLGETMQPVMTMLTELGAEVLADLEPYITEFAENYMPAIKDALSDVGEKIGEAITWIADNIDLIVTLVTIIGSLATVLATVATVMNIVNTVMAISASTVALPVTLITVAVMALVAAVVLIIKYWDEIKAFAGKVWNAVKDAVVTAVEAIKEFVINVFEAVKEKVITVWNNIKESVTKVINGIKEGISNAWNNIKSVTSTVFDGIKSIVSTVFNGIKTHISNVIALIKAIFTGDFGAVKGIVKNIFDNIKNTISNVMDTAKDIVKKAIDKLKGFFNFNWSLPKIKMPHVTISGKFSLDPPSVPKFSIDWYAKGGVFDSPTLFGYGGNIGGLGENGAEAIVPLEKNLGWLDKLASMLSNRMGSSSTPIVLQVDGKTFAQTSINTINQLTRQTGNLGLNII